MEKEIVLEFRNYKMLADSKFNLNDFNIYLVEGKNESGKSTVLTALQEIYLVSPLVSDPVTSGAAEGSKTFQIPDCNGDIVTVKHTFDRKNHRGKFVAFDKNGSPLRKVSEIRNLLGSYSRITTEQFFDKARTAEGRRDIVENYFSKFLSDTELADLKKQKDLEQVNYDLRTEAKKELDLAEKRLQDNKLTPAEEDLLSKKESSQKLLKELREQRDTIVNMGSTLKVLTEREKNIQEKIDSIEETVADGIAQAKERLPQTEQEIVSLEERLKELKKQVQHYKNLIRDPYMDNKDELDGLKKQKKEAAEEIKKERDKVSVPDADLNVIEDRISKGENMISHIAICESKKEKQAKVILEVQESSAKWEGLDLKVRKARSDVRNIYEHSSLPSGVQIEDDTFTLEGFDFSETQISESKAKLVIAEIMCQVDTAPLLVMGNAGSFGEGRLNDLCKLAEKHNKIMFLEKVVEELDEVKVVGVVYNKTTNNNPKMF